MLNYNKKMRIIAGLGNPEKEYELTRHNAGRIAVEEFRKQNNFEDWRFDKKLNALKSEGNIDKNKILLLLPETFMNKSGSSLKSLITSTKKAKDLIIVQDDIDLALGKLKISFGKNSGGHKGIESIIKVIKTKEFARVRIGITPTTTKGKLRKPSQEKILDFITKKFKPEELKIIKRTSKKVAQALETAITSGIPKAMNEFN